MRLLEIPEPSGGVLRRMHNGEGNVHPSRQEESTGRRLGDGVGAAASASHHDARSSTSAELDSACAERVLAALGAHASAERAADDHRAAAQGARRGAQAVPARGGEPRAQHRGRQERAHPAPQTGIFYLWSLVSFTDQATRVIRKVRGMIKF